MKIRRIFLMTALAAALIITSVVPVLAETAVNDPNAAVEDVLLISQAPAAATTTKWTSSKLKAAKVSLTSVKSYRYDKIKLTWEPLSGVDGYQIYRATSKSGTYSKVNSVTGASKSTYINGSRTCGKTYYYKVRAYKKISGKNVYSKFSTVMSGKAVPSKTTVVGAWGGSIGCGDAYVEWKGIAGATDYEVQYRITMPSDHDENIYPGPLASDVPNIYVRHFDPSDKTKTTNWKSKVENIFEDWLPFKTYNTLYREAKKKYPSGYVTGVVLAGYPQGSKIPLKEYVESTLKKNQAFISDLKEIDGWIYQFRVRAYKVVGGKKIYGAWSEPYTMVETLDVEAAYKELKQYAIDYAAKNYPEWRYIGEDESEGMNDSNSSYYIEGVLGGSSMYVRQEDFVKRYKKRIENYIDRMKSSGGQQEGFIYIKRVRPEDSEGIWTNNSVQTFYEVWMLY